jgi:hypothetical protein
VPVKKNGSAVEKKITVLSGAKNSLARTASIAKLKGVEDSMLGSNGAITHHPSKLSLPSISSRLFVLQWILGTNGTSHC